ncbi:MAG: hypothetical protein AAFP82_22180 [Bacteroidota bacterium]
MVPVYMEPHMAALASEHQEHDKVQVFSGNKAVANFGVTVQGSGSWAKGTIKATITSYDYKALYSVYTLKDSESAKYWFVSYRKDTSHDELKKTFESSKTVTTHQTLEFEIQGNDYGINSVFITYEVIRVTYKGVSKDYVVTNSASAGAMTPSGDQYPGGFKPVN